MINEIYIYMFGVGQGDSIAVRLPANASSDSVWGVIDVSTISISGKRRIPVLDFLRARKVKSLEFLCLSHPHRDHYSGMHSLLDYFGDGIKEMWDFGLDLNAIIDYYVLDKEAVDELTAIRNWLKQRSKKDERFIRRMVINWGATLYSGSGVSIVSLGPNYPEVERVQSQLLNAIVAIRDHRFDKLSRFIDFNSLSGVLEVRFGRWRLLFTGDCTSDGLNTVIANSQKFDKVLSKYHVVKVPHHGSKHSNDEEAWDRIRTKDETVALISNGKRRIFPDIGVLEMLNRMNIPVFCTRGGRSYASRSEVASPENGRRKFTIFDSFSEKANTDEAIGDYLVIRLLGDEQLEVLDHEGTLLHSLEL